MSDNETKVEAPAKKTPGRKKKVVEQPAPVVQQEQEVTQPEPVKEEKKVEVKPEPVVQKRNTEQDIAQSIIAANGLLSAGNSIRSCVVRGIFIATGLRFNQEQFVEACSGVNLGDKKAHEEIIRKLLK